MEGFRMSPVLYIMMTSSSGELVFQGGTNSGKTYGILLGLLLDLIRNVGYYDSDGVFHNELVVVYTTDLTEAKKTGVLNMFTNILTRYKLWSHVVGGAARGLRVRENKIIFDSGGVIVFSSTAVKDTARKSKPTQAFFNEANFTTLDFYSDVKIRTYKRVISDFNSDERFWLHREIDVDRCNKMIDGVCVEMRPNSSWLIEYHILNYTHNIELAAPYVDEHGRWVKKCDIIDAKIKDRILELKRRCESSGSEKDCRKWYVLGLGKTGSVAGNVYTDYNLIELEEFEVAWRNGVSHGYGVDYGYVIHGDPLSITKNVIYEGEVYSRLVTYEYNLKREAIALIFEREGMMNYPIVFDNSHVKETFDYLLDMGYNMIAADRSPNSILSGINLLSQTVLNIVKDDRYEHELNNYKWRKKFGEYTKRINPTDKWNHALDSLRYWYDNVVNEPDLRERSYKINKPIIL